MSNRYDAIVVGGGLAGLTSAAYLCRYGYRTLLCEKGEKTGGLVGTFWHQGFAFDSGIRALENSGILLPMLKSLGIDLEFMPNLVSIGIGQSWVRLTSQDSLGDYAFMLTSLFPDRASDISNILLEIHKVMDYMDVLYGIENPLFLENMGDIRYLTKTLLPWLLRYQVNIRKANRLNGPVIAYLRRFTKDQALIDMIAQHFFQNTPTFFALSYFGLYLDYCYPRNGTGVLAQKISDFICSSGGEILTGTQVRDIDLTVRQITTTKETAYQYSKLVWAADQKTLYAAIQGHTPPEMEIKRRLVERGRGGDSILTLFAGVNLGSDYFQASCGAHAFYTLSTQGLSSLSVWQESAEQGPEQLLQWVADYLARTTYEISCPALRDPSLAPDGQMGIIVSTLMEYRLVRCMADMGQYDAFKEFCTQHIMELLEESLFPGIREKTLFTICSTPITIERETGNAHGAITGWAFGDGIPAENRFQRITNSVRTPIRDIVQCGQWTFSPSGLPVSILTGKLAADAVRKSLNRMET